MSDPRPARCSFYVRTAARGGFTYEHVSLDLPAGEVRLSLDHPPAVGDLVDLPGGVYRVAERAWRYSQYGSGDWPRLERHAKVGPMLDLIVDRAEGPFRDEVEQEP